MEIFKDIPGFEGLYKASVFGRIFSCERKVKRLNGFLTIKERSLKLILGTNGYFYVTLRKGSVKHTLRVHRLVAKTFIPNPDNKQFVNHKNGIKLDNSTSNLEWVTSSENNKHAYDTGLKTATSKEVIDSVSGKSFKSITEASEENNISKSHLANMLKGRFKNNTNLIYKTK